MLKWLQGLALVLLGAATGHVMAADSSATVTVSVNDVSHGTATSSQTESAKTGTKVQDGEYLKTGVKSRAELELPNLTVTRLGANTIFNYSVANNEIDLQAGTILFSKPKDGAQLTIKSAAVTAAIVGTTGFLEVNGKMFLFGLVEGKAVLHQGNNAIHVGAGQILRIPSGGAPQIFYFNIPQFLKTSPLVTKFNTTLPNQAYIDREVRIYNDFVKRGFISPPTTPVGTTEIEASIPVIPLSANDSAANALKQFNNSREPGPPPPPPPPPVPPPDMPSNPFGSNPP